MCKNTTPARDGTNFFSSSGSLPTCTDSVHRQEQRPQCALVGKIDIALWQPECAHSTEGLEPTPRAKPGQCALFGKIDLTLWQCAHSTDSNHRQEQKPGYILDWQTVTGSSSSIAPPTRTRFHQDQSQGSHGVPSLASTCGSSG